MLTTFVEWGKRLTLIRRYVLEEYKNVTPTHYPITKQCIVFCTSEHSISHDYLERTGLWIENSEGTRSKAWWSVHHELGLGDVNRTSIRAHRSKKIKLKSWLPFPSVCFTHSLSHFSGMENSILIVGQAKSP